MVTRTPRGHPHPACACPFAKLQPLDPLLRRILGRTYGKGDGETRPSGSERFDAERRPQRTALLLESCIIMTTMVNTDSPGNYG